MVNFLSTKYMANDDFSKHAHSNNPIFIFLLNFGSGAHLWPGRQSRWDLWARQMSPFGGGGGLARGLNPPPPPPQTEACPPQPGIQPDSWSAVWSTIRFLPATPHPIPTTPLPRLPVHTRMRSVVCRCGLQIVDTASVL